MRTLPIELSREFDRRFFSVRHCMKFEFTSKTYQWTDADTAIYADVEGTGASWWQPKAVEFDSVKYEALPGVDNISFDIDNADNVLSDLVLNEDTRGKAVYVYAVGLDFSMNLIDSVLLFYGFADQCSLDQTKVRIEAANHMIKWRMQCPRRIHAPGCQWRFQDPDTCAYSTANSGHTDYIDGDQAGHVHNLLVHDSTDFNTLDSKVKVKLTDGTWWWDKINAVPDGTHVTLTNGIPAGSTADDDGEITSYPWCDHSFDRCEDLGNEANFGGFRWLQYLQDKSIWWGRARNSSR